ncbi:hypothetical protein B0H14DRAFT_3658106, partial [Mycena olivaceomarginata]
LLASRLLQYSSALLPLTSLRFEYSLRNFGCIGILYGPSGRTRPAMLCPEDRLLSFRRVPGPQRRRPPPGVSPDINPEPKRPLVRGTRSLCPTIMVFILASRLLKLHGLTECVGAVPTLSKAAPKDKRCAAQKTKFGLPSAKEELGACICVVKIGICRKLLQRHYLGLDNKPRTLRDILATQDDPSVGSLANPRVVWRNRDITNATAQRRILSDTKCRPEDDLIIDEDHGYMTALPGESASSVMVEFSPL